MAEAREAPFGHEPPGVDTRRVVGTVVTLGTLAAIALVALWLVLRYLIMPDYVQLQTRPGLVPPAPRLQPSHAHRDLEKLRAEKTAMLSGYAWTDKSHRFARIPIRRAMEIYVAERKAGLGTGDSGVGKRETGKENAERATGEEKAGLGTRDSGLGTPKAATGDSKRRRRVESSAADRKTGKPDRGGQR